VRSLTRQPLQTAAQSAVTEQLYLEGRLLRALVGCTCSYEAFALATRSVPTVSHYCREYPWVGGVILGGLVMHFYYERQMLNAVAAARARSRLNRACTVPGSATRT
jgi:hypothetical protein